MLIDKRELRIIFQNALSHATQITMHNAKDREVSVDEVIATAKKIAIEVVQVGQPKEKNGE